MRVRLTFSKTEHMRYTGNLDVQRTLERILSRARLPVSMSQGFSPRAKINIAAALPLGVTSGCELADIWFDDDLVLSDIQNRFEAAAPPGIQLHQVEVVDEQSPKLQNIVETAAFIAEFLDPIPELESKAAALMAKEEIWRERRDKPYNLRALILDLRVIEDSQDGNSQVAMHLVAQPGATGRPDEVIAALGYDPNEARYHRTHLSLKT